MGFKWSISRDFTTDRRRFTRVNVELEATDWGLHTYFSEGIPVVLDDLLELISMFFWAIGPVDVSIELFLMKVGVELDDVVSRRKFELGTKDCLPVIFKQDVVIPQFVF